MCLIVVDAVIRQTDNRPPLPVPPHHLFFQERNTQAPSYWGCCHLPASRESLSGNHQRSVVSPSRGCSQHLTLVNCCFQSLSCVQLFETPWTAAHQTSLSFTISQSLLKLMSIESVMPSHHLILCRPLLLLPSMQRYKSLFPRPEKWATDLRVTLSIRCSLLCPLTGADPRVLPAKCATGKPVLESVSLGTLPVMLTR